MSGKLSVQKRSKAKGENKRSKGLKANATAGQQRLRRIGRRLKGRHLAPALKRARDGAPRAVQAAARQRGTVRVARAVHADRATRGDAAHGQRQRRAAGQVLDVGEEQRARRAEEAYLVRVGVRVRGGVRGRVRVGVGVRVRVRRGSVPQSSRAAARPHGARPPAPG
eukprot:scaffold49179_cov49-Phaeocystis_antarctica.AAC.2